MKYYKGLKIRLTVSLILLGLFMLNAICLVESYEVTYFSHMYFVYASLNFVICGSLCAYSLAVANKLDDYEEKRRNNEDLGR